MGTYRIDKPITRARLQEIANERFGDLVKGVVDIENRLLVVGQELHVDGATELQEKESSKGEHLWGINLYPAESGEAFIEFDSVINLKPQIGNRTRGIEDALIQSRIINIVRSKISDSGL